MNTVMLDGRKMTEKNEAFDYIVDRLGLPSYTGKNLDALWDSITETVRDTLIVLRHASAIRGSLGEYGDDLIGVFAEAENEKCGRRVLITEK